MYAKPLWTVMEIPDGLFIPGPHGTSAASKIYPGISSAVAFIINGGEALILDSGARTGPEYPTGVLDTICKILDSRNLRLKYLVQSHWHFDHTANTQYLRERYGGEVLCHPKESAILKNPLIASRPEYIESFGGNVTEIAEDFNLNDPVAVFIAGTMRSKATRDYNYFSIKIDRTVEDGEVLPVGDLRIQVLHVPGHTPGSLALYNPSSSSLYIVDVMYWPTPLHPHPIGKADEQIASIRKLLGLEADYLFPGHELPRCGRDDVKDYLEDMLLKYLQLEYRLLVLLNRHGALTITDLHAEVFPIKDRYYYSHDGWYALTMNCLQSYMHKLLGDEKVRRIKSEDGKLVWDITKNAKLPKQEVEVQGSYERVGKIRVR